MVLKSAAAVGADERNAQTTQAGKREERPHRGRSPFRAVLGLERAYVLGAGLVGSGIPALVVLDGLALPEIVEPTVGDRAVVEEDVFLTVLGLDESESAIGDDASDSSLCHSGNSLRKNFRDRRP